MVRQAAAAEDRLQQALHRDHPQAARAPQARPPPAAQVRRRDEPAAEEGVRALRAAQRAPARAVRRDRERGPPRAAREGGGAARAGRVGRGGGRPAADAAEGQGPAPDEAKELRGGRERRCVLQEARGGRDRRSEKEGLGAERRGARARMAPQDYACVLSCAHVSRR